MAEQSYPANNGHPGQFPYPGQGPNQQGQPYPQGAYQQGMPPQDGMGPQAFYQGAPQGMPQSQWEPQGFQQPGSGMPGQFGQPMNPQQTQPFPGPLDQAGTGPYEQPVMNPFEQPRVNPYEQPVMNPFEQPRADVHEQDGIDFFPQKPMQSPIWSPDDLDMIEPEEPMQQGSGMQPQDAQPFFDAAMQQPQGMQGHPQRPSPMVQIPQEAQQQFAQQTQAQFGMDPQFQQQFAQPQSQPQPGQSEAFPPVQAQMQQQVQQPQPQQFAQQQALQPNQSGAFAPVQTQVQAQQAQQFSQPQSIQQPQTQAQLQQQPEAQQVLQPSQSGAFAPVQMQPQAQQVQAQPEPQVQQFAQPASQQPAQQLVQQSAQQFVQPQTQQAVPSEEPRPAFIQPEPIAANVQPAAAAQTQVAPRAAGAVSAIPSPEELMQQLFGQPNSPHDTFQHEPQLPLQPEPAKPQPMQEAVASIAANPAQAEAVNINPALSGTINIPEVQISQVATEPAKKSVTQDDRTHKGAHAANPEAAGDPVASSVLSTPLGNIPIVDPADLLLDDIKIDELQIDEPADVAAATPAAAPVEAPMATAATAVAEAPVEVPDAASTETPAEVPAEIPAATAVEERPRRRKSGAHAAEGLDGRPRRRKKRRKPRPNPEAAEQPIASESVPADAAVEDVMGVDEAAMPIAEDMTAVFPDAADEQLGEPEAVEFEGLTILTAPGSDTTDGSEALSETAGMDGNPDDGEKPLRKKRRKRRPKPGAKTSRSSPREALDDEPEAGFVEAAEEEVVPEEGLVQETEAEGSVLEDVPSEEELEGTQPAEEPLEEEYVQMAPPTGSSMATTISLILGIFGVVFSVTALALVILPAFVPVDTMFGDLIAPIVGALAFVFSIGGLILAIVKKGGGKALNIIGAVISAIAITMACLSIFGIVDLYGDNPTVQSQSSSQSSTQPTIKSSNGVTTMIVPNEPSSINSSGATNPPSATDLSVGNSVEFPSGISVTVNSVTEATPQGYDGKPVYCVNVTYENKGDSSFPYNQANWYVEESSGVIGSYIMYLDGTDNLRAGTIAAQTSVNGNIYFDGPIVKVIYKPNPNKSENDCSWRA